MFLAREPAPEQRVEIILARLCAMFATVHGKAGGAPSTAKDFLLYLDAWKESLADDPRYNEVDREVLSVFGVK